MLRFAANISMMYPEYDFLDRFEYAAKDGFDALEILFPHHYPNKILKQKLQDNNLMLVLFNANAGDFDHGERGMACIPGREDEFRTHFLTALENATNLGCEQIHLLAGIKPKEMDYSQLLQTYQNNLLWAAQAAQKTPIKILIEPINTRDMPGYFLNFQAQAHEIVKNVGMQNIRVQMDFYHCQIMEGDLAVKIKEYLPTGLVNHLQIAGVPERFEPDIGEINYSYLFSILESMDYRGYIGCEYRPSRGKTSNSTTLGLDWLRNLPQR